MTNLSLYNIDQQIIDLINSADENGEINAEAFDQLQMAKKDKMLAIVHYINFIGGNCDLIDAEIERLKMLKASVGNRETSLKNYLKSSMEREGTPKVDLGTVQLSIRNNPPSVIIDDECAIAERFTRTKEVVSPDKLAIKEAYARGEPVYGTHLESTTSLTIK